MDFVSADLATKFYDHQPDPPKGLAITFPSGTLVHMAAEGSNDLRLSIPILARRSLFGWTTTGPRHWAETFPSLSFIGFSLFGPIIRRCRSVPVN